MGQEIKDKVFIEKSIYKKRILKSFVCTIIALFVSFWGVFALFMEIFNDHTPEAQNVYLICSFFIVAVFIIFYCTFTILYKLENK